MASRKKATAKPAAKKPTGPPPRNGAAGTALIRIAGPLHAKADAKPAEPVKVPDPEGILVPAALLLAAASVSATKDAERPWLLGVFLHEVDGVGRVAGGDGGRVFVGSFPIRNTTAKPKPVIPAWMSEGIILSNEDLRPRISLLAKAGGLVALTYADGLPKIELADDTRSMVFRCDRVTQTYPDYTRALPATAFGRYNDEGEARGREWEPVGINSAHLKHVGDLAKILDNGLAKEDRSKNGMIVRAYNGGAEGYDPLLFDFSGYPGAILVIMPPKLATLAVSKETAAILAPAAKLTIAALRAHSTRWIQRADAAGEGPEREACLAKAQTFVDRVAAVISRLPGQGTLLAPPAAQDVGDAMDTPPEPPATPDASAEGSMAEGIASMEAEMGRPLTDEERAEYAFGWNHDHEDQHGGGAAA